MQHTYSVFEHSNILYVFSNLVSVYKICKYLRIYEMKLGLKILMLAISEWLIGESSSFHLGINLKKNNFKTKTLTILTCLKE